MESIEAHIDYDKKLLDTPTISSQQRRHIESELEDLEIYHKNHPNDHHDPSTLELYCEINPNAPECKIYEN
jgi:hypothetical protein